MQKETKYTKENPLVLTVAAKNEFLKVHPEHTDAFQRMQSAGLIVIRSSMGVFLDYVSAAFQAGGGDSVEDASQGKPVRVPAVEYAGWFAGGLNPQFLKSVEILRKVGLIVVE